MCETKPNLGALGYLRDRTRDAGQIRQTNPIPRLRIGGQTCPSGPRGSIAPNKPNLAGRLGLRRAQCAKQTQFRRSWMGRALGDEGRTCKTNPISGKADRWDRPIVRDKANFPRAGWDEAAGAEDAGQVCETKPIWRRRPASRASRTNKANSLRGHGRRSPRPTGLDDATRQTMAGAVVRNNANFRRGVDCAKQSQFPPGWSPAGGYRVKQSQFTAGARKTIAKASGLDDATR
jgi:hypothetical protein